MMILSECRKVWSIRLIWDQEIAGSNPAVPTKAWKTADVASDDCTLRAWLWKS